MMGYLALILFVMTVPAANWLIGNVGTECLPNGPCVIPTGFGFTAPSGVLMVGAALVLRDIVHERLGWVWAAGGIFVGALLSALFATPALVIASVAAFALAELADLVVYAPLRRRRLVAAVFLSGLAGAFVDSAVFLVLAFGSLNFIEGQVIGKLWMSAAAVPFLLLLRHRSKAVI